ncbi:hypothetical protein [Bradyrhizobium guangdongense]|uniref:Uncharacterized protein n=1 Tax=Bradyrhizobium guangdongense TaxID=1325090 RepID=A0A410V793_9BRAD|nr:hypothetical protein [Bradyrhizobium guangdongense]QAU39581.1 hypothetical protein X265_19380 [Bradyrhizobium guangdongense]QOZ60642.1 hypothetical protein XH86_19390 [Bradyrhizobium guangdongense]GGI24119.1 hypothetical protein GCM10010987_27790 [Bradyrhizobium guangdongense]
MSKEMIAEIERWRDNLRDAASSTLNGGDARTVRGLSKMQRRNPRDIPEAERRIIERARNQLSSLDELLKIAQSLPHDHQREHMLHSLWTAVGATFVIANRAHVNPIEQEIVHKRTEKSRQVKKVKTHDPQAERIKAAIAKAEEEDKNKPAWGKKTRIENSVSKKLNISSRTVRSYFGK